MDGVDPEEEQYPEAPLPRHERVWRHPSELGESMWQRSEPPLSIGRGLLVTSGAIGGLLALAVLWAMLPTSPGGGSSAITSEVVRSLRSSTTASAVVAASTTAPVSELTSNSVRPTTAAPASTLRTTTPRATPASGQHRDDDGSAATTAAPATDPPSSATPTTAAPSTTAATSTSTGAGAVSSTARPTTSAAPTTTPAPPAAVTQATIAVTVASDAPTFAIAVSVGNAPLVLTTAAAVHQADSVTLAYTSGKTTRAKVTMTYRGIAVLAPDNADAARPFDAAAAPRTGDVVILLGPSPTTSAVTVGSDGTVAMDGDADDVAEGTPVVNAGGQLVGLCSHGSSGTKVLTVDVASLRRAVDSMTGTTTSPAWLGVQLNADPKGSLTINYVDPNGPAAAAGIVSGDTIVAADGKALTSSRSLYDALAARRPDDAMDVTLRHADGTVAQLQVILAVAPASA